MPNNTPGPWQADNHEVMSNGSTVAFCYDVGGPTAEANARLIAAAPKLLAALKEAEHMLKLKGYTPAVLAAHGISAAIAEAEGVR